MDSNSNGRPSASLGYSLLIFCLSLLLLTTVSSPNPKVSDAQRQDSEPDRSNNAPPYLTKVLGQLTEVGDRVAVAAITRAYYPNPLTSIQWQQNDVMFHINGRKVFYAKGRLLREELLSEIDTYRPIMYQYRLGDLAELFPNIGPPMEQLNRIPRSVDFQVAVSNGMPERSNQQRFYFFSHAVSLHPIAGKALRMVEQDLQDLALVDDEILAFINNISSLSGYSNRKVEKSVNTSMHAFGLAVDITPIDYHGKEVYWQWTKNNYPNAWKNLPLERRWVVPDAIVQIFENHGFLWGGKWRNFDSMHFEYRPEILFYSQNMAKVDDG